MLSVFKSYKQPRPHCPPKTNTHKIKTKQKQKNGKKRVHATMCERGMPSREPRIMDPTAMPTVSYVHQNTADRARAAPQVDARHLARVTVKTVVYHPRGQTADGLETPRPPAPPVPQAFCFQRDGFQLVSSAWWLCAKTSKGKTHRQRRGTGGERQSLIA